jgi:hypothetical protein
LIAAQSCRLVDGTGALAPEAGILFRPGEEKGQGLVYSVEALVVQVAAIHDVERTGLQKEEVQDIDIV